MVNIVVAIIGFGLFIASVVLVVIMAENESFGLDPHWMSSRTRDTAARG